jgi:hypothetical protein
LVPAIVAWTTVLVNTLLNGGSGLVLVVNNCGAVSLGWLDNGLEHFDAGVVCRQTRCRSQTKHNGRLALGGRLAMVWFKGWFVLLWAVGAGLLAIKFSALQTKSGAISVMILSCPLLILPSLHPSYIDPGS